MDSIIDLKAQNIIVTGAGSGIGRETAVVLSRQGARVVILDLNEGSLNETLSLMEGDSHLPVICDLTDFNCLPSLVEDIVSKMGPLDGLVHCAGVSSRKPLNVLRPDGFSKVMNVNFYSFVELCRLFTKRRRFRNGGSIVVMSSISSIQGYKAKTEYCVSKSAIDAFVRCLALELADKGIRVNSVMPGEVNTPMGNRARDFAKAAGYAVDVQPLGITDPHEVANTIAFLLSNATKTITGTTIKIDGGATI